MKNTIGLIVGILLIMIGLYFIAPVVIEVAIALFVLNALLVILNRVCKVKEEDRVCFSFSYR